MKTFFIDIGVIINSIGYLNLLRFNITKVMVFDPRSAVFVIVLTRLVLGGIPG